MGGCGTPPRFAGAVSSIASLPLVRRLVQPGNDCAADGPNAPPLETRDAVEALLHALQCGIQPRLADPYRQVATCLLEDSTSSVGRAAQIAGNSVGIVQRNQQGVDLVHVGEQRLALIELAKDIRAARARGEESGLSDEEIAFYDALAENESAREAMGEPALRVIAHELVQVIKGNVSTDWMHRDSARARIRVHVKRLLRKYGYPPDLQDAAVQNVLQQAEALSAEWAA